MNINDAGLTIIKTGEGLRLTAYQDIRGIWTIGWGHTPARSGQVITQAQADQLLLNDIAHSASAIDALTHDVAATENQFSAMVSLAFNIGTGVGSQVGGFAHSSVLRFHRQGAYAAAGAAFLLWDKSHVDGKLIVVKPLLKRRQQEEALYLAA